MTLGQRLKQLRKSRDIQQKKLALDLKVGQATISQWESGRQEPNPAQRKKLCKYFGLSEAEFFGFEIDKLIDKKSPVQKIPLISWISANRFADVADPFPPGVADDFVYSTNKGGNMFALKVINDCMVPEFQEGDIIIVKPNVNISNGDFVVIRDTKNDQATFKQYKKYGDRTILHPLNPKYQDIELDHDERYEIIGKVVEKVKKY